ncbi:uncharacterized protein CG7065-like isoform X2 [Ochlerotatus camptorhynchus]|uniref:uncharacterized protein CG7065-like isoform X2 n=1 Tax=Ochlerotatus camptorhynchus TaxID=644619 RepID=UPI0031DB9A30
MDEDCNPFDINDGKNQARSKTELDVEKHLLGTTVKLSDGTNGRVFSRNGRNKENLLIYSCHLCGVANLSGERILQTHIAGRKHQTRLNMPMIDADQFRSASTPKVAKVQMHIAPGEPVPPGMENEVKPVAELQATIDRFKDGPMVGLEYIMELSTPGSKEPSYHCVLCDKKGDPRTIVVHITSYIHRMKFLEKHYPTVINELAPYRGQRGGTKEIINRAIQTVCEAIEDHHGRLTPNVHDSADYARNKMKYLQEVLFDKHFDERTGPKFVEVIDKKMLQEQMAVANGTLVAELTRDPSPPVVQAPQKKTRPARADRKSLDSISSMDSVQSISSDDTNGNARSGVPRTLSNRPSGPGGSTANPRSRPAHYSPPRDRRPARSPEWRRSPARRSPNRRRAPVPFRRSPDRGRFGRHSRSPPPRRRSRSPPARKRGSRSPVRRRSPIGRHDRSPMRFGGDRKSRSPEPEKRKALPTPKQLALQASEIAHERYKWEKYRCSLEIAVAQLEKAFKEHEKNPEKHPMYPEEWKKFWNRRYKELQAEKKDPSKHDFKPEWIGFWTKRMKELHDEDIDKKKAEIKKKLNLPDEESEKIKELREQYTVKVSKKKRSVEPIESSDDDKISVKSKTSARPKNVRVKRSRSPISADDFEERSRHSSSRHYSRDRDRERERAHYKMASYLQEQQDYDEWARSYYGPNKTVFVRTEFDAEDTSPLNFVAVCRLLTALEEYLGSLGPKVIDLLSKALALEKVKANSADELLLNEDNCMFLETVKEKLKGHLMADMVEPQKIPPVKKAIKNIASLIHEASKKEKKEPESDRTSCSVAVATAAAGGIDKAAIAQKLAAALVAQGKTDFTSEELEELINVYVAMAEASKEKDKPVTTSSFLNEVIPAKSEPEKRPESSSRRSEEAPDDGNALEGLTDSDLQTLLQNFKDLSNEEQLHLISHLKKLEKTDPVRVEKLRRYVNLDDKPSSSRARDEYYDDEGDRNYGDDNQHYNDDDGGGGDNFDDDRQDYNNGANQTSKPGNPIKPLVSGSYGGDSPDPYAKKKLIDSEDEDDYSYDDVVRAASKNVIVPPTNSNSNSMQGPTHRADFTSDNYDGNSNFSRASNEHGTQMDTQNIIANLMGSLPGKSSSAQSQGNYSNPISTIGQSENPRPNPNFYDSSNPSYGSNPYTGGGGGGPNQPPGGPPGGPYMNQQNRPQFAPIQTANTSVNSMPYYYQQQMRAQQPQMNPRMPQQQMNNFAGGPPPPRPPMQNTFPWQQNSGQRQPSAAEPYQYGNNYY